MLTVLVLTAVLLPFTVTLSMTVGSAATMAGIAVVVVVVGVYLWRTASDTEVEFQSAVKRLGETLATRAVDPTEQRLSVPSSLPGLDDVTLFKVEPGEVVGKTLAELDLRARTGATVVAVRRASGSLTLPSGTQRVELGDVLALAGTDEAITDAKALLGVQAVS
jgi:CPA2 family monovalent cation:H+ antiporter-2